MITANGTNGRSKRSANFPPVIGSPGGSGIPPARLTIIGTLDDMFNKHIANIDMKAENRERFMKEMNEVYRPYVDDFTRTQIFFGGSSSGKSVFLAQRCILDILEGDRNYLICRAVARTIRKSVFAEIKGIITGWDLTEEFQINKAEMVITHKGNGRQIIFVGLDDVDKLKSIRAERGALTDVWIEEATETDLRSIKQLMKRQRGGDAAIKKRMTLSFNPIYKTHFIFKEYFEAIGWRDDQDHYNSKSLVIRKTWYIHNRFLTSGDIYDLENEEDSYFKAVYTFGNWGILGDAVYSNWRSEDLTDLFDTFDNLRDGLDFGFSSDPAAVLRTHYDAKGKKIYIYDELYERKMTNDVLAASLKNMDVFWIYCDSAEPKSIKALNNRGIKAIGALKGKDSLFYGIQWIQGHEIIVDPRCVNTISELHSYQWKKDARGNSLPIPIDRNNHAMDALRYAYANDMIETKPQKVKVKAVKLWGRR